MSCAGPFSFGQVNRKAEIHRALNEWRGCGRFQTGRFQVPTLG